MNQPANIPVKQDFAGRDGLWLGVALLLIGLMLFGLWQSPQRINAESALYLQEAQLMLQGAVPYVDFVDANPPVMMYLCTPPALLAQVFDLSPIPIFIGLVIVLLVISSLELYYLLRQRRMGLPTAARGLVLLTWIASYFVVDWREDIGQREYLFMLLYMPFLFLRILRYRGGSIAEVFAFLLGMQAGIGAGLKPLFLLVAVNVELVMLFTLRQRRALMRPEMVAFLIVSVAMLAHWLIVPASMREAFFGRWLPLVNYGYGAYNVTYEKIAQTVLKSPVSLAAAAGVLAAAMVCIRRRAHFRQYFIALASLAGMAMVLIFIQKKGWSCHRIPLNMAGMLCLALLTVEGAGQWAIGRRPKVGVVHWTIGFLALGILLAVWFTSRENSKSEPPDIAALRRIVEDYTKPNDRVLVVSSTPSPAYPLLVQTGRRPGSRYLYAFPIACCYAGAIPAKANQPIYRPRNTAPVEEQQFLGELEDDTLRRRPGLIILQNTSDSEGLPDGFNLHDYLFSSGWAQIALRPYREISGPEGWKVFERVTEK